MREYSIGNGNRCTIDERTGCEKWIADIIGEDYKNWGIVQLGNPASRIFIESSTGTGKTSFILDKLFPYAAEKERNILYLGNRTALEEQTKYALERRLKQMAEISCSYTMKELSEIRIFQHPHHRANITILNYQSVVRYINFMGSLPFVCQSGLDPNISSFYYVIFDEAHFFLEDAQFNPWTFKILEKIIGKFKGSAFIFMSATLEESMEPLLKTLYRFKTPHQYQAIYDNIFYFKNQFLYTNLYQGVKYNLIFFKAYNEIIEKIKICPEDEKWLIFVSSKQEGNSLKKNIREQTNRKVSLLTADKKTGKIWERLVRESRFKEDILIVTKVLDNGANIIDPTVKHVVLPFCYRIDYIQMLGRRRAEDGETIYVYSKCPVKQSINSQLRKIKQLQKAMRPFVPNPLPPALPPPDPLSEEYMTRLLQDYWRKGNQAVNSVFYIDDKRNLVLNPFASYKVGLLSDYYSKLAKADDPALSYPRFVYEWLKIDNAHLPSYMSIDGFSSLDELLIAWVDRPIPKEEQERFYKNFQHYYKRFCIQRFGSRTKALRTALSIRKGKTRRKLTINESLAMLELPYHVVKRNNCWVLEKLEDKSAP